MIKTLFALVVSVAGLQFAPVWANTSAMAHPEARVYDENANAMADVDAALERAAVRGALTVIVMGANWCHDSRALAGWFQSPRFETMLARRYEVVFVDAGRPQDGDWHYDDVARRFGIISQENTPMVLLADYEGAMLNSQADAKSWRNAADRDEEAIFDYFANFGHSASSQPVTREEIQK